jgi:hypothetical protein
MCEGNTVSVPDRNCQENPFTGIRNTGENMFNNLFCIWPKTTTENDIIAWNFFFYVVKTMGKIIAFKKRKWNSLHADYDILECDAM